MNLPFLQQTSYTLIDHLSSNSSNVNNENIAELKLEQSPLDLQIHTGAQ